MDLGEKYRNIEAVLGISAQWATEGAAVTAAKGLETIHDFFGFPSQLYHIEHPAHGDPDLAGRVAELLSDNGVPVISTSNAASIMVPGCPCISCFQRQIYL